jgi:DNA polymerase V
MEITLLALCDCNNFFVSCERLYRPELRDRPVVVLSSNDGCIIARSNEVKAMGIKMGEPFYQVRHFLRQKGVVVCSGNLTAYKEISDKVMQALARCTDALETYSIDEAFMNFPPKAVSNPGEYAAKIRRHVDRVIGVPISIGVAPTKTLTKLAASRAKKTDLGVLEITARNSASILKETKVEDVWGIGRQASEKLKRYGITSAADFIARDPVWIKKHLSIRGVMTQYELQGQPCIPLVTQPLPPKSIQVSRTWGSVLETAHDVYPAILDNILKAGRLLRQDKLSAQAMSVYLRYGYRHHGECGYFTEDANFDNPIRSDIELTAAAKRLLGKIFRPGYRYTQGGVILCKFSDARYRQLELFDENTYQRRAKFEQFSQAVDAINEHYGERVIYPVALAVKDKKWRPNRKF